MSSSFSLRSWIVGEVLLQHDPSSSIRSDVADGDVVVATVSSSFLGTTMEGEDNSKDFG
jgi:hypothetical protein